MNIGAGRDTLTYHSSVSLNMGQLVEVPVGKRQVLAVVTKSVNKPEFTTREVAKIYKQKLPKHILDAVSWLHEYYKVPLSTILQTVIPAGMGKKRRTRSDIVVNNTSDKPTLPLNQYQEQALADVRSTTSSTILLHGITGSGKTNIYIKLAKDVIAAGKSVVILVPEIALTSQLIDRFSTHFDNLALIHSKQTEAERHLTWECIASAESPMVVIGPRSAIFAPVGEIGLIVIDEAHEPSYKQEQSPKYNTLRLASFLANKYGFKVVLGTATPLVADYYLAEQANGAIVSLKETAIEDATPPGISVVNLTSKTDFSKHRFFSNQLLSSIEKSLANGKQSLIFHNRRGSASLTICGECGWQALCDQCSIPLTLHADTYKLTCHTCCKNYNVPTSCPECHNTDIVHKGIGTKLIESELAKLWPKARLARFDGDTHSSSTLDRLYQEVQSGEIQLLIGTQILAKGLDLPKLETVGVIQADANLSIPDFGSEERVFQLLSQVIGRVGRGKNPSKVVVQTYQPDNPAIRFGVAQDYAGFYNYAIKKRRHDGFPPFSYLLKLTCTYKTEDAAVRGARKVAKMISQKYPDVVLYGPAPSFHERPGSSYRWQLTVKSKKRSRLLEILDENLGPHWQVDIDPTSLL